MSHLTLLEMTAEMCRIRSLALLWHPKRPLPWPVHRLQRLQPLGEFGNGTILGDVAIYIFPYCFFFISNLTGTDGDSSGCGPGLWGSLHGKCFQIRAGVTLRASEGHRLLAQGCGAVNQAACGGLVWGGGCSSNEQFYLWLSCVGPLNKPMWIPEFSS